jgi:imidazoleglycerol phosphate synthase glutamine amidotransferase subunit HisH
VFSSDSKMMYGTQFHPEKSGDDGLDLIKNFLTT